MIRAITFLLSRELKLMCGIGDYQRVIVWFYPIDMKDLNS